MRNRHNISDPERKAIMEAKSVVLTHITDYMGMQCIDPPCGRTEMKMSECMFCQHKEIIAGRKEKLWV